MRKTSNKNAQKKTFFRTSVPWVKPDKTRFIISTENGYKKKRSQFLPISRIQIAGRNREKKWLESCSENKSTVFSATLLIGLYSSESRLAISRFKNFVSHFELTSFDAWKQLF